MTAHRLDAIPKSWYDDGRRVAIRLPADTLLTGRLNTTFGRDGLIVLGLDRVVVGLDPAIRVEDVK